MEEKQMNIKIGEIIEGYSINGKKFKGRIEKILVNTIVSVNGCERELFLKREWDNSQKKI